jgi:hypothetical protein
MVEGVIDFHARHLLEAAHYGRRSDGMRGGGDLSYSFWHRRYGGSASVMGEELTLEGYAFPIIV